MLAEEVVTRIQEMIAYGERDRDIARQVGVGRRTVTRIRAGYIPGQKWRDQREHNGSEKELEKKLPRVVSPDHMNGDGKSPGRRVELNYIRCPGCGGKVQSGVACYRCEIAKVMAPKFDVYLNELLKPNGEAYPVHNFPGRKGVDSGEAHESD